MGTLLSHDKGAHPCHNSLENPNHALEEEHVKLTRSVYHDYLTHLLV